MALLGDVASVPWLLSLIRCLRAYVVACVGSCMCSASIFLKIHINNQ